MGFGGAKGGWGGAKGGWGGGKGHHGGKGLGVVAEIAGAAIIGGLAGAAVASAVGHHPHPRHHPHHRHEPEVIVVGGGVAPVVVVEARPKPKPKARPVVIVEAGGCHAPVMVVAARPALHWKGKGKGKGKWKGQGKGRGYVPAVVVIEQAPVYAAAPAEASPFLASAPPLPAPSAPPLEEYQDDGSVLAIEIPAGVAPGTVLGITVMDGSQVNFTVPEDKHGGDTLELWYDAATGTLTPM